MRCSIVMSYFNRRKQLLNTLATIKYFGHDPEIIIVDDGSSERIDDIKEITLIRIEPKDKWWYNPCVPFNIGFSQAKEDIIIIQNPECLYTGDIISYALNNISKGRILSFGAYSLDYPLPYSSENFPTDKIKAKILQEPQRCQVAHHGWYNHSVHRPVGYHFCNAILKTDLEIIGGFDERYAKGVARDDDDLLIRMKRAGLYLEVIDDPFVVHQQHDRTDYRRLGRERQRNEDFWLNCTLKEDYIKPLENKYYGMEFKST